MLRTFDGLAIRQLGTRRLRSALTCFGIVLGVGMMFGVLVLVSTVRGTFDTIIDSAWGKTDLLVSSSAGMLPERTVNVVRREPGVKGVAPWVGATFARLDANGHAISGNAGKMLVAGYDPRGRAPFDYNLVAGRRASTGFEVDVERSWARDRDIELGETIPVVTPTGRARLRVVGILRFSSGLSFGGTGMAAMPLSTARRVMDMPSGWYTINVFARDRDDAGALQARLRRTLGKGIEVQTPSQVGDDFRAQVDALNAVLYYFSGVALFVGAFLILNSFNMTVLQRMREIGILRTLGATRGMIVRTVMLEALALGLIGSVLGLALGIGLAFGLVKLLAGLGIPIGSLAVPPSSAVLAVAIGLAATGAAALWPARRAGRVAPIRAVLSARDPGGRASWVRLGAGVALLLPGMVLGGDFWFGDPAGMTGAKAALGIAGTMAMFAGLVAVAPFVVVPLVRVLALPLRRVAPSGGRLAADAALSSPVRTAATAAALTIGLSVFVVNSGITQSFLGAIDREIDQGFARDFTVQPLGTPLEYGGEQAVPASLRARIARMPQTEVVTPLRSLLMELPGVQDGTLQGIAVGIDPPAFGAVDHTRLADGVDRAAALRGVADGGVIVGKAYAEAAHLKVGDTLTLQGAEGRRAAPVVGVMDAIGEFQGHVMQVSLGTLRDVYGVRTDAALAVRARSGDRDVLEQRIAAVVDREYPNLELLSAADVKDAIDKAMSQQFALFNGMVAIAVLVSLLGVINTLAMSALERTREIGVLRALGSSRWQIRLSMLNESLLITTAGAIVGVVFGALVGWIWISGLGDLIPGLRFEFPLGAAVLVAVVAVVLGTVAAVLPARRAARLNPIDAITYE